MWASRLTPEEKAGILADYSEGKPVTQIAEAYGVHHSYPTLLARRRGLPTRLKKCNVRYMEKADETP